MPVRLPIEARADEKSFHRAADQAQKAFADAGRDAGKKFSDSISEGARESSDALRKMSGKAQDAYDKMRDAAGKVRAEEVKLDEARQSGNTSKIVTQAERLEKARRDEARATRKASESYQEYDNAAKGASDAGKTTLDNFIKQLGGDVTGIAGNKGRAIADSFSGGFGSSSKLAALGTAAGPIGLALAGVATIGVVAGKELASALGDGMQIVASQDFFKARMGLDDASVQRFAASAGAAYAAGFGDSMTANLDTVQQAIQSGLLPKDANKGEVEETIKRLHGISDVFRIDISSAARAAGQLMRTGFASNAEKALDIVAKGEQEGLDISGDFLTSLRKYPSQFSALGLSASDVLTLMHQAIEGGARDTDTISRSIREFWKKSLDGSKSTTQAFEALGFNADDMTGRIAAGGEQARGAFEATLTAIQNLDDPMQQASAWGDLFGTQWNRMGDAINNLDLSDAKAEFEDLGGTTDRVIDESTDNAATKWDVAKRKIGQSAEDIKVSLEHAFAPALNMLADMAVKAADLIDTIAHANDEMPGRQIGPPASPQEQKDSLDILLGGTDAPPSGRPEGPPLPGQPAPAPPTGPPVQGPPIPGHSAPGTSPSPLPVPFLPPAPPGSAEQDSVPPPPVPGPPKPAGADEEDKPKAGGKSGGGKGSGKGAAGAPSPHFSNVSPTADFLATGMDSQARMLAESQMTAAREELEQAQKHLHDLEADNNASAEDIQDAKDDVLKKQKAYLQAEKQLAATQQQTLDKAHQSTKSLSEGMEQIGAKIDQDFGISKGLPGIADNLVKFLANLAMAPALGALGAVTKAFPGNGGKGIAGMLGTAMGLGGDTTTTGAGAAGGVGGVGGRRFISGRGYGAAPQMPSRPSAGSSKQDIADYIYGAALQRGYSPHDAQSILAYAIGESGLNPGASGGEQGGSGAVNVPIGLFQQKPGFAAGGGISPSARTDPMANTQAYLNQLEANRGMPIEQALPATSVGGPLSGAGAQPWSPLMDQARGYISAGAGARGGGAGGPGIAPSSFLPGLGAGLGAGSGAAGIGPATPGVTGEQNGYRIGGMAPAAGPGGPGFKFGGGGLIGLAEQGGINAIQAGLAGVGSPGPAAGAGVAAGIVGAFASQAAQIGVDEINRAVSQAGQVAGIATGGVLETLTPHGSKLADANNSWIGRIAAGAAGAKPALPNLAGGGGKGDKDDEKAEAKSSDRTSDSKSENKSPPKKNKDGDDDSGSGGGTTFNNTFNMEQAPDTEDRQGADIVNNLQANSHQMAGPGPG
jgi:phage-related minor tail protein